MAQMPFKWYLYDELDGTEEDKIDEISYNLNIPSEDVTPAMLHAFSVRFRLSEVTLDCYYDDELQRVIVEKVELSEWQ